DGSIASYTIDTLPPADQAVLFLGDPANGGVAVTPGQVLTPAQLQQLFLQATGNFTGTNFTYRAKDNSGAISPVATASVAGLIRPTPTPTDNQPPVANNANSRVGPNSSRLVTGLGGSDPDGSIVSYTINTLPSPDQAVLFLGDPALGGVPVTPGQVLTPAQLQQLFFQTKGNFTGANFTYSATDNSGATSPATATVAAILPTDNQPPVANNANSRLGPNSSQLVTGLGGSDPDGSIVSYTIDTLPSPDQAVLFLGDPANGGVPVTPGQVLTPAQLQQLFFQTKGNFTGANFTYSATDNSGASSPAAATVAAILRPVAPT
ncbi:Ig-like domain-containing protein, partial [Microcoleus sp. D3_18a_C4]|uniref:Ig-like domain-containing protein n=1 Tax=Microcoleus sp. D3_18a_C4 TaxID=3055332 RepID=UPI003B0C1612